MKKRREMENALPYSHNETKASGVLIDTKKELAKIAGVSHDTIERVKKIQEKTQG